MIPSSATRDSTAPVIAAVPSNSCSRADSRPDRYVCAYYSQVEVIEKGENERRAVDDKKRKEEVDFLKYQGQHLDSFLKQIGGSK